MIKAGDASPSQPPGHGSTMEEEAVDDATVVGGEIKVLGAWASPFVLRVRVALHLKGLDYEYVEEDVNSKSDLLLASNPVHEKVPVLLHGGRPVCESLVIVEYLDDAFPAGAGRACFLPADPHDRAVARFWAASIDDQVYDEKKIKPPRAPFLIFPSLIPPRAQLLSSWVAIHAATTEEEKSGAVARTLAAVDALEGALAESGWFGGDGVGFVDIALGGLVPAIRASELATGLRVVDPARNPRLAAWVERFCAIDAARAAMPAVHRLVEMGKKRLAVAEST
jgi:glutathione S-transferase